MTPKEKIADVEQQIKDCTEGRQSFIVCPYCKTQVTSTDNALCCNDMGLTVRAILRKMAQFEVLDQAARIADKVADLAARN